MRGLLKVSDCANLLGVSPSKVYELIARRKITYVKLSGKLGDRSAVRLRAEDIEQFVNERTVEPL